MSKLDIINKMLIKHRLRSVHGEKAPNFEPSNSKTKLFDDLRHFFSFSLDVFVKRFF